MTLTIKLKNFFSNLKEKIINLRTNKTFLICCFLSVLYLLSGYFQWLELAVSLFAVVSMIFLPLQSAFCIFLFLHSFTLSNISYNSFFTITFIGTFLVFLIKYIIGASKGKYQYHKNLVIAISCFYVFSLLMSIGAPRYNMAWYYLIYLPFAYVVFCVKKDLNIRQAINYMFGGLIVSSILAVISLLFVNFQYEIFNVVGEDNRFRAFTNNTNYLYMRALFVLSYYMFQHINKNLSFLKFIFIYLICALISVSTLSKTAIGMLVLISGIYLILLLKQDFKKNIKFVGIIVLIALIFCVVGLKFIMSIWERFSYDFNSANVATSLFTGRNEIWDIYSDAIFNDPLKALFGHGLVTQQLYVSPPYGFGRTETHNLYLFLLYRFGIVGTVALGYIIYLFVKESMPAKPKFIAYLPLIFLVVESLFDNTFKVFNFSYFMLTFIILFPHENFTVSKIKDKKEVSKDIS